MLYYENCGKDILFSRDKLKKIIFEIMAKHFSTSKKVLILPPDITRIHSKAGILTAATADYFSDAEIDILPALGTHVPMTLQEINLMFPGVSPSYFLDHNWRKDLIKLGTVPGEYVEEVSRGKVHFDWPAQVNRLLVEGHHDVIFSIGQVVPHEVIGFANHNKNIFIGIGGAEAIHKSHFLGAAYGMERIMGQIESPVRSVLNYATDHFAKNLPVVYILTVVEPDTQGMPQVRGLFIGDGYECYNKAAEFSKQINCIHLPKPIKRAVVYLDPQEYRSTWLGNKAIYRTRLALADDAELTIIAPGLKEFAEDSEMNPLIQKYGYRGSEYILDQTEHQQDLSENLAAAAHLIHGSSEGRFKIRYAPGHLSAQQIKSVGYDYMNLKEAEELFQTEEKQNGLHKDSRGEDYYFIKNPALGLWDVKK